jgi:hypothetical protein
MKRINPLTTIGTTVLLLTAGCSNSYYDILNTNAPTEDQLSGTPTKAILARAAVGAAFLAESDLGGDISEWAIFGREGYNLLGNDPRLTQESLKGPGDPNGFLGFLWQPKYTAIRTYNTYLDGIPKAADMTAEEKAASVGFAQTLKALMFYRLILRDGDLGIPIAVQVGLDQPPAPFVSKAAAYDYIVALLDSAQASLATGGATFPFNMPPGYEIASTPATFIQFNRALAAEVQIHRATAANVGAAAYQAALTALAASFIDPSAPMSTAVNYAFSANSGEPFNPISEPLEAQRFYIHPSIVTGAQHKANGDPDNRLTAKTRAAPTPRSLSGLTATHKPVMYNNSDGTSNLGAPIPIIKNEELLLIRAEARWFTGDKSGALADINVVRTVSGGLPATSLTAGSSDAAFVTELLYNRLYSLLWEQGTRWLDAIRFGLQSTLPIDRPGDIVFNQMLVPGPECDARQLGEPCDPLTQQH